MKSTEVKKLIKSIVPYLVNPHWDIYKDALVIQPTNDLLRGVYFNRSGMNSSQFELCWFIQPLYVPSDFINLSFGEIITTPNNLQWWEYHDDRNADLSKSISHLINKIDANVLSKIDDAETFYEFYKNDKELTIRHFEAVAYSAACSELEISDDILEQFLSFLKGRQEMKLEWVQQIYFNTERLLKGDRKEILRDWEMQTRSALKI